MPNIHSKNYWFQFPTLTMTILINKSHHWLIPQNITFYQSSYYLYIKSWFFEKKNNCARRFDWFSVLNRRSNDPPWGLYIPCLFAFENQELATFIMSIVFCVIRTIIGNHFITQCSPSLHQFIWMNIPNGMPLMRRTVIQALLLKKLKRSVNGYYVIIPRFLWIYVLLSI